MTPMSEDGRSRADGRLIVAFRHPRAARVCRLAVDPRVTLQRCIEALGEFGFIEPEGDYGRYAALVRGKVSELDRTASLADLAVAAEDVSTSLAGRGADGCRASA